jgi:hypothetical protein
LTRLSKVTVNDQWVAIAYRQKAMDTLIRLTAQKAHAIAHLEYLRKQFSDRLQLTPICC